MSTLEKKIRLVGELFFQTAWDGVGGSWYQQEITREELPEDLKVSYDALAKYLAVKCTGDSKGVVLENKASG